MITMGIDGSTTCTGWSIFDDANLIAHGAVKPKGDNWRDKVMQEWPQLYKVMDKYRPQKIFVEDVPLKDGKPTLVKLGAVHGMVLCLAAEFNAELVSLLPSDWRSPLGLYDGTRQGTHREVLKKKAIEMVNKVFGLNLLWVAPKSKRNEDDEAEAILICYSQVKRRGFGSGTPTK